MFRGVFVQAQALKRWRLHVHRARTRFRATNVVLPSRVVFKTTCHLIFRDQSEDSTALSDDDEHALANVSTCISEDLTFSSERCDASSEITGWISSAMLGNGGNVARAEVSETCATPASLLHKLDDTQEDTLEDTHLSTSSQSPDSPRALDDHSSDEGSVEGSEAGSDGSEYGVDGRRLEDDEDKCGDVHYSRRTQHSTSIRLHAPGVRVRARFASMDMEEREEFKRRVRLDLQEALTHLPGLDENKVQSCIGVPQMFQSALAPSQSSDQSAAGKGDEWILVVEYLRVPGVAPQEMVDEINRQMQDATSVLRRQSK